MSGRLDAVNILDADAALVTTVDLDHTAWLGPDREAIGAEKAGIFRAGRPAVYGDEVPPQSLVEYARALGAHLYLYGRDYRAVGEGGGWSWESAARRRHALATVELPGRFHILDGVGLRICDVAHNAQAARALAAALRTFSCSGRTHAVLAMLADKDQRAVAEAMAVVVDEWHVAGLSGERGTPVEHLAAVVHEVAAERPVHAYADVPAALRAAQAAAAPGDRIVVFGSFHTVAAALQHREAWSAPRAAGLQQAGGWWG